MTKRDIPVFINVKDRATYVTKLFEWLAAQGCDNITLIDTGSTHPDMLAGLETTRWPVTRVHPVTEPHLAIWNCHLWPVNQYYIYTDCDVLPVDECPPDWFDRFMLLLDKYPQFPKVGFGLKTDDLPDHYARKQEVIEWEKQFWTPLAGEAEAYNSAIDTTFALYRPGASGNTAAIRTGPPYVARHLPWYEDSANPSEEEKWYKAHMAEGVGHWR
jgi:hypothetical protein